MLEQTFSDFYDKLSKFMISSFFEGNPWLDQDVVDSEFEDDEEDDDV